MHQPFGAVTFRAFTDEQLPDSEANIGFIETGAPAGIALHVGKKRVVHITRKQALEFFGIDVLLKDIHEALTGGTDQAVLDRIYPILEDLIK